MGDIPERGYGTFEEWTRRAKEEPEKVLFHIHNNLDWEAVVRWKRLHKPGKPHFMTMAEAGKRLAP